MGFPNKFVFREVRRGIYFRSGLEERFRENKLLVPKLPGGTSKERYFAERQQ